MFRLFDFSTFRQGTMPGNHPPESRPIKALRICGPAYTLRSSLHSRQTPAHLQSCTWGAMNSARDPAEWNPEQAKNRREIPQYARGFPQRLRRESRPAGAPVDRHPIIWPDGTEQIHVDVAVDRVATIMHEAEHSATDQTPGAAPDLAATACADLRSNVGGSMNAKLTAGLAGKWRVRITKSDSVHLP